MATSISPQTSSSSFLQPLFVCPGHEWIQSAHESREKAKEVGTKWLEEQGKNNQYTACKFDVRQDIQKVHALVCSYRHQAIENCSSPHVIFPAEHTFCSGHKQTVKTHEGKKKAEKVGREWLKEKRHDKNYTDCSFEISKDGGGYSLVYSYKHQNLDASSNPYLRFPCQFLTCLGHPHVHSLHSKEKKAEKEGSKWLKEKQKDKNSRDVQKAILKGPKKNHALIYNFKHPHIDTCPKPHPIFPEFLRCPGHSLIFKTYETREKAKEVGTKWLHQKQDDRYYQNCSFDVKAEAKKVHNLICYFEHQHVDGCSNARTAFDHFVENDHPSLLDKTQMFLDKNKKTILIALAIANYGPSVAKEVAALLVAAKEANNFDAIFQNLANHVNPSPIISAHPQTSSSDLPFPSSKKDQERPLIQQKQVMDLSQKKDPALSLDHSFVERDPSPPSHTSFQNMVSCVDVLDPHSMETLQQTTPFPPQDHQSSVGSKLNTHLYQPLKNNVVYAFGHPLFQGTLQAIGGAAEMAIGASLTMGTSGVALPFGGALMYHGYDHLTAGLKTAFTRQSQKTITTYLLQKIGLSCSNAVFADDLMGALAPIAAMRQLMVTSVKWLAKATSLELAETSQANQKVIVTAQEVGLSTREMFKLKEAGKLNSSLCKVYENIFPSVAARKSFELFQKAEKVLKPYTKIPMSEVQIRELIQSTGVKTFPRPAGIPQNFLVKITKDGAGIKYINPINSHISIRIMPGKPHSELPFQQKPYVIHMKEGYAFDQFGNKISHELPEAHIPIDKFIYRD